MEDHQDLSGEDPWSLTLRTLAPHVHKGAKIPAQQVSVTARNMLSREHGQCVFQWPNGLRAAGGSGGGSLAKLPRPPTSLRVKAAGARPAGWQDRPSVHTCPVCPGPSPPTWMYFMNRWHFPQRERGLPVAARGEKDTSISSSMPESEQGGTHTPTPGCPPPRQPVYRAGLRELPHGAKSLRVNTATPEGGGLCVSN